MMKMPFFLSKYRCNINFAIFLNASKRPTTVKNSAGRKKNYLATKEESWKRPGAHFLCDIYTRYGDDHRSAKAILNAISSANLTKLQTAQNSLAPVVTSNSRFEHTSPILHQLHWLPTSHRIQFKLAILVFKIGSTGSPVRLSPVFDK